jgi:hypothetical protein
MLYKWSWGKIAYKEAHFEPVDEVKGSIIIVCSIVRNRGEGAPYHTVKCTDTKVDC